MKKEMFDELIKESIDNIEDSTLSKKQVMMNVYAIPKNRPHILKRMMIVLAACMLFTSVVFAAVEVYKSIDLKNDDEVVATVDILDTENISHEDVHYSRAELFNYSDRLRQDKAWREVAHFVLDTEGTFSENIDITPRSDQLSRIEQVKDIKDDYKLPNRIGVYEFINGMLSYEYELPSDQELLDLLSQEHEERFIVRKIPSGDLSYALYAYETDQNDLGFTVSLRGNSTSETIEIEKSLVDDYEVITIGDRDVFLYESSYGGVIYHYSNDEEEEVKVTTRTAKNYYKSFLYMPEKNMFVSIDPELDINYEVIDNVMEYPVDTRERLIEFITTLLSELDD